MTDIDALVAEKVMGWHRRQDNIWPGLLWWADETGVHLYNAQGDYWRPSTDIAQAWQVMERMVEQGWEAEIVGPYKGNAAWGCDFGHHMRDGGTAEAASAPLAICLAALDTLGDAP